MAARGRRRSTAAGRCWWRVQPSLARANTPRHGCKLQLLCTKASWLIHWHMAHADGAYASVRLHEVLPCFPRRPVETCGGLTSSSQSPRGRPCCVPRATPVRPGRRLRGCTLLPHLTVERKEKAKRALSRVFLFLKKRLFGSWKKRSK